MFTQPGVTRPQAIRAVKHQITLTKSKDEHTRGSTIVVSTPEPRLAQITWLKVFSKNTFLSRFDNHKQCHGEAEVKHYLTIRFQQFSVTSSQFILLKALRCMCRSCSVTEAGPVHLHSMRAHPSITEVHIISSRVFAVRFVDLGKRHLLQRF